MISSTLVSEVREIDSLRLHVAANAAECRETEAEMWRAIGRMADAWQSVVAEMMLLRRWMIWCCVAAIVSAFSSLICVVILLLMMRP